MKKTYEEMISTAFTSGKNRFLVASEAVDKMIEQGSNFPLYQCFSIRIINDEMLEFTPIAVYETRKEAQTTGVYVYTTTQQTTGNKALGIMIMEKEMRRIEADPMTNITFSGSEDWKVQLHADKRSFTLIKIV